MRKSHPHESPLDYMQSSHCPPEVGREFHSNSGLVRHRDEAFPETPNQAEVSFHGHRAEQWQQHTALLGGVGSCSTYIWKTNPGRRKKKTQHWASTFPSVLNYGNSRLTRSRSMVLSRHSSCAMTAWLEELVYSREATSLATCRRVLPKGSSSTPSVVSMGFL